MSGELERRELNIQLANDISTIKTQIALVNERTSRMDTLLNKLHVLIYGNGKIGLVAQVKINTQTIKEFIATKKFTINRGLEWAFRIGVSVFVWYIAKK